MTTANCGAHDELDFKLVFGEDGAPAPPPSGSRPAGGCRAGRDWRASVPSSLGSHELAPSLYLVVLGLVTPCVYVCVFVRAVSEERI